jgi:Ca2+-binding EF-hand superfamily protein
MSKISQTDLNYIETNTNYDCDKIIDFYKKFNKKCPYGYLSREDFKDIFKTLSDSESKHEDLMLDRLFQMCDVDSNGFIDFKEYIVLFWSKANGNLDDKLKFIFDMFDSDKSGYIDFYELHKIVKILYKLKNNNKNEDEDEKNKMKISYYKAYINKNNDKNLLTPSYYISFDIMKKFDVSRNGMLSREEFISGCENHDEIRRFLTPLEVLEK